MALQVSVLWHCPEPSTLILANGSGRPKTKYTMSQNQYTLTFHKRFEMSNNTYNSVKPAIFLPCSNVSGYISLPARLLLSLIITISIDNCNNPKKIVNEFDDKVNIAKP